MENVLLVIHLLACIALVIAVLLQRSEGGALGMGGGGTGGLISGRGAASVLVRTTMVLAAVFITTSIVMTRLNAEQARAPSAIEREIEQRENAPFDPLASPSAPGATPATTLPATPTAPAIDPLAPPAATTPPATQAPAAPAPAPRSAPATTPPAATTQPTQPAPQPAQPAPEPAPATPPAGGTPPG